MADLNSLPPELLLMVIGHFRRPSQLKVLCLVSNHVREAAARLLYNSVTIYIDKEHDHAIRFLLQERNPGLKYIRHLTIRKGGNEAWRVEMGKALFTAAARSIPENALHSLRLDEHIRLTYDTMIDFVRKQKMLTHFSIRRAPIHLGGTLGTDLAPMATGFDNIDSLGVMVADESDLLLAQKLLARIASKLRALHIHISKSWSFRRDPDEYLDSHTSPGVLTRTLFKHMVPFDACEPFSHLTDLELVNVDLSFPNITWLQVVDLGRCCRLRLVECPGTAQFLASMYSEPCLLGSVTTLELRDCAESGTSIVPQVGELLKSISGLIELRLELCTDYTNIEPENIIKHASSLRILQILLVYEEDGIEEVHPWSSQDFERICEACTRLEQLSCAWPDHNTILDPSEKEWQRYLDAVARKLPNLITLHILNLPRNDYDRSIPMQAYHRLLRDLACSIFERCSAVRVVQQSKVSGEVFKLVAEPSAALRLVAFGIPHTLTTGTEGDDFRIFVRSIAVDADGLEIPHAAPISAGVCRYEEQESHVLEYDFRFENFRHHQIW